MESKISVCFLLPYRADRFENGWLFFIFLRSLAYAIYRFIFPTPDGTNGAQNFRSYTSGSHDILPQDCFCHVLLMDGVTVEVLGMPEEVFNEQKAEEVLNWQLEWLRERGNKGISAAFSSIHKSPQELDQAYDEACMALVCVHVRNNSVIVGFSKNEYKKIYDQLVEYSGNYAVWGGCVPDFSIEQARTIFTDFHKQFVADGIDPSGLDGEQYHSLFGVLYMQTILAAFKDNKTLSSVRNAGALSASYPFVLYSDLYDHVEFIRGCCTAGFSGVLWTPEVRDAETREEFLRRLQSNVFSVQCLINAWYCEKPPWEDFGCENEVRELLRVRENLIPMLSTGFKKYNKTGIPPVRALVCDYTDDPDVYQIDDEYIFCDALIVAPIPAGKVGRNVYLPDGKWVDFFSKEPVKPGSFFIETESIPVYEKIS